MVRVLKTQSVQSIGYILFREFNNCYILLLNSLQTLENTGFIAGELSLIVSLVLYRPVSVYEL